MNTHFNVSDQELAAANGGLGPFHKPTPMIDGNIIKLIAQLLGKHGKEHYAKKGPLC